MIESGVPVPASDAAPIAGVAGALTGPIRVLCLGNELIADDALGIVAAQELARRLAVAGTRVPAGPSFDPAATGQAFELPAVGRVEVVETALTGMYLLEAVVGASKLIVIDSVLSGAADPGTVLELTEADLDGPRGGSPHYIGLLETLELARALGLAVPAEVAIIAVEVGDSLTVGGRMTAPVAAAVPIVAAMAMARIAGGGAAQGGAAGAGAPGYDPG
jgi:hydrogenase maturation protease